MRLRHGIALAAREMRAPQWRLLWLALVLAAAALSSVGFLAQRLQAALQRDAAELLGGALVVQSDEPLPARFAEQARRDGLRVATSAEFASMALAPGADGGSRLVVVKAVGGDWPLLGRVRVRIDGVVRVLTAAPAAGTAWAAPGLTERLGVAPQGPIVLGARALRVAGALELEPDHGAGMPGFAPRVLINAADLASTGLIQPASRVRYRLLLDAAAPALARYAAWARRAASGLRGVQLLDAARNDGQLGADLHRGAAFLQLVALLSAVLAAVACAVAAHDFARRQRDRVALLKALGMSRRGVLALLAVQLSLLGVLATAVGCALGLLGQLALLHTLGGLLRLRALPPPGWQPAGVALLVVYALLAAFALPPLARLAAVPPLQVLRRQTVARARWWPAPAAGGAGLLLLWAVAGDRAMAWRALLGCAAAAALFALGAWALTAAAARLGRRRGGALALAARQLGSQRAATLTQITALALALLALLLVAMLRAGLFAAWQSSLPADAPNRFVINVQPQQAADFRAALRAAGIARFDWYPMVRARLVAVNGRPVHARDYPPGRARALVERAFNLSTAPRLPPGNRIVGGSWQPTAAGDGLSVEAGLARTLGLHLGDRLRFDSAGTTISAPITSLRALDWASLHVNFFVLAPPALLAPLSRTYIGAFRVGSGSAALDTTLPRRFPDITLINLDSWLEQLQRILARLGAAAELLFGCALAVGLTVMLATLLLGRHARRREIVLWRALGASGAQLRRVAALELLLSGLCAGLLASPAAALMARWLARRVFDFGWTPEPAWFIAGPLLGAVLALAAGWWSLRAVLRTPPMWLLRAAD